MNYLGRVASTVRDFYQELNSANLSGAIDVIVIRQSDGSLRSTPFYVRFGKLGVLRPGDLQKQVEIEVNGTVVPIHMKLDETGSAFFVEQDSQTSTPNTLEIPPEVNLDEEETPTNSPKIQKSSSFSNNIITASQTSLASSKSDLIINQDPTKENIQPSTDNHGKDLTKSMSSDDGCLFEMSDGEVSHSDAFESSVLPKQSSVRGRPANLKEVEPETLSQSLPDSYMPLSDSETLPSNVSKLDSSAIHSDTELEIGTRTSRMSPSYTKEELVQDGRPADGKAVQRSDSFFSSITGLFKRKHQKRFSDVEEGLYLEDIENVFLPPEERNQYFPSYASKVATSKKLTSPSLASGDDNDSGLGGDTLQSREGMSPPSSPIQDGQEAPPPLLSSGGKMTEERWNDNDIQLSLCGPMNESGQVSNDEFKKNIVTFEKFSEKPTLLNDSNLVVKIKDTFYSWKAAAPLIVSQLVFQKPLPQTCVDKLVEEDLKRKGGFGSWFYWPKRSSTVPTGLAQTPPTPIQIPNQNIPLGTTSVSSDEEWEESLVVKPHRQRSQRKKHNKSIELSPEHLKLLNLKEGLNEVTFSVTTRFQGTSKADCIIYLWDHTDKIVISDIDGTITKSDVAGHLLPILGKDWTHAGVVNLFQSIVRNGYKIVYLSSRPIGAASYTKNYLKWVRQKNSSLPDGPVLVAPLSLLKAFSKEVIEKKPEEFKIKCLETLRSLFPSSHYPFFAGFGNKATDMVSYKSVGIPLTNQYTINPKGEVRNNAVYAFKSSYMTLKEYLDLMFPPCDAEESIDGGSASPEYTFLNFWKHPIADPSSLQLPS